jgi:glycosyltransferase involved in cell wall biosynthesis
LKITYIVSKFPKLSETFVLGQITDLIDRGHDVGIISIEKPTDEAVHEEVNKYNLLEKTHYINKSPSVLGFELNDKVLSSLIFTDLIHAHFAANPASWALKISQLFDIPFVFTAHAYDIYINPDVESLKEKFEIAKKVITISNYNKKYLLNLLGQEFDEKIEVIRCGIDLNKFKHIQRTPKDIIKILFVGRFVEKKGASYAIETIDRLLKESHNIELRMIGDGPLMNEAKNLMNDLSLNEKIVLLGPQPHSIVLKEMEEADIFFLPSITADNGDREGIPVSIMEAQATGLPVVSTVHSGIPELVIDSKTGFLVPENDTAAMAEKLKELITNYKLRINMGELGRSQIESIYDREKEIDQLDKLFRSVCKNKTLVSKMSEEEINTISQRVGKLGDQLKRLDTEITQKNEQLEQLTKDKKHKNQQIQEKNKEIQEKNKEIQNRNNQIQRVEEKTATLQKRLDTIQSKLAYKAYIKAFSFVDYIGKQIKKIR